MKMGKSSPMCDCWSSLEMTTETRRSYESKSMRSILGIMVIFLLVQLSKASDQSTHLPDTWRGNRSHKMNKWLGKHGSSGEQLEMKIESSVRTLPSVASSWESSKKSPKGPYINLKWKQGSHSSYSRSPSRNNSSELLGSEEDLTDRKKRTEDQKPTASGPRGSSQLIFKEGAYEGLVVEVSDQIPQDDCRTVIDGLQTVLLAWSNALLEATEGMVSLRTATVVLPNHWSTRACHPPISSDPPPPPTQKSHLKLEPPHPVFGDSPWTQQSGGCGVQGDFIQMGVGFLQVANSSAAQASRAASVLVGEWGKYRWGLFSESGFQEDPLYMPWYRKGAQWAASVCTDAHVHHLVCHPDQAHHCAWPPEAHRNATSSLLALPHLPQVTKFCDSSSHNAEAPTKQNALCSGRSAWEVMKLHQDFAHLRYADKEGPPKTPYVHFIRKPNKRFILLIEDTTVMNVQRRWEFVRKAVRRVVVYDLPNGVEVALVVFNAEAREAAPLSMLESTISDLRERVGSSLPRNPSGVRPSQGCIVCGLQKAIEVLEAGGYSAQAANIVLVTSGEHGRETEAEKVRQVIQDYGLRLLLVLYPLTERPGMPAPEHSLVPVARESGGRVFTVMDEGVGIDSKVSMLVSLMEALTAAVAAGGATTPVLLHSATYQGGIASLSTGAFSLDDSVAAHARFAIYYYDLNHVGNTIHLTAPSGATFASVNMQEEDGDVNMISVNLNNAERGVWRYKVENRADSHQALHIQVTSFPNLDNKVTVRVWSSQESDVITVPNQQTPIILYGEVKMGGAAVMDAGVMATLQRLGTNATGGTYVPVRVQLLDLGTGDPDITRGDGVYSRYAPPLEGPARYSVVLSVDAGKAVLALAQIHPRDHDLRHHRHALTKEVNWGGYDEGREWAIPSCCGSVVPFAHTRQAPAFTRQVTGPTLDIRDYHILNRDKVAPARIVDLVAWVNTSSGQVVLDWTAVGEDRDWGRAQLYEGFIANSKSQAATHCSGERIKGLPVPSTATTRERARISITLYENKGQWVCIRAIDSHNNKGPPSNPAAIWRPLPPSTDRVTIRARGPGGSGISSGFGGYGSDLGIAGNEKVAVISGCIGGLILVVLLVVVYWYCLASPLKRRLNRRRQPHNDSEKAATSLVNGGSVVVKSTSRGSVLINPGPESANQEASNGQSNTPHRERREISRSPDLQNPSCDALHGEQPSSSPNSRRDGDGEEDSTCRGLSMSIPDVTKVDCGSRDAEISSVPTPQFFTLGRHSKSSPNKRSPLKTAKPDLYGSAEINYAQSPVRYEPVGAPQYYPVRPRQTAPDSYSDGPDDSSLSEQLLCDDRASSPPPPAPADHAHSYSSMQRHSIALL
ncbi:calcium-activated chloride channel regulator 2-like [Palaemon carinicauda]|uniref:calcium-activated chloride channel regulator 2-like n=1 Tax=Palaemon carinicauda TaxID=392227 RepID=UPI0035B5D109